jgi:sugar lactone lactonase YvrE
VVASLGIAYLVAEEAAQLGGAPGKAPAAPQPIVLYCANCKAPLSVDGSSRIVRCQYCSTDVYLPDDLWQRLHPVATVARWYLCTSAEHVAARRVQTWQWGSLEDVVMDPAGNLYCVGAHEDAFDDASVWCLAPDLSLRWFVDLKDFAYSDAHLALDPGGRLLVWREHKHSALVLSAQNGATLGKLGGKQPDGATAHTFDLDHAKWLRFDADGSILALLGERLVRFSGDGGPLPTWPPKKGMFGAKAEKLRPIYGPGHQLIDVDGVYIEHVGSQPTELDDYTHLHVGWDGRLYAERSEWVACFDRSGERVYRTKLPVDDMKGDYLGTDAAGNLYVPATLAGDPRPRVIVRVSPDGKRVDTIATDHRQGGVVGDEDRMVVRSDGIIVLLGYGMRWRVIGPDGGLRAQSDKSRQEDASELARDAAED